MQNKNLMVWLLVSMFLVLGWAYLQNQLRPPPQKKQPPPAEQAKGENPLPVPVKPVRWDDLSQQNQAILVASLTGSPLIGTVVLAGMVEFPKAPPPIVKVTPPQKKPVATTLTLGGRKHNLVVTLTTKGAGVQKLELNKFQAANWLGQPVPDKHLELIQEDSITPSFLMYHYPSEKAEHPVFTLGDAIWEKESKQDPNPDDEDQEVRFSTRLPDNDHVKIIKTYRLRPGTYHLELSLLILDTRKLSETPNAEPSLVRYQLTGSHGMPIEGEWYTSTFRSSVIGMADQRNYPSRDLETADRISHRSGGDRVPHGDLRQSIVQYAGVMTQYFASLIVTDDKQPKADDGSDGRQFIAYARATQESQEQKAVFLGGEDERVQLAVEGNRLESVRALPRVFTHIKEADFQPKDRITVSYYAASDGGKVVTWIRRGHAKRDFFDDITVRVQSQPLTLKPGQKVEHNFLLYHGPAKVALLSQFSGDEAVAPELVDRYAYKLNLRMMTDYGRFYWWSDLLTACTKLMHFLLYYLRFFGDGMSIILLTILVRGMLIPIGRKQAYFSVKMQELAPEMKKLQEKYKNDAKAKTEATMELYRKHNVHPLGGCLPLLLQMPIFIGLYFALGESIHFRLAKFLWIDNLAAPDMLIYWSESIPLISDPDNQGGMLGFLYLGPYFNLLPLFAVGLMIAQQIIMTPPPQDEQQAMQFKMMRYMMVIIGIMFYKIAAGLCMYIIISTLWGLGERRFLPKKKPAIAEPPVAPSTNGPRTGPSGRKQPPKPQPKKNEGIKKFGDWWQEVLRQAKKK